MRPASGWASRWTSSTPVTLGGERLSSSAVREALAVGDLARAERLLGRPYTMIGRVVRGEQLGRKLGYPDGQSALSAPAAAAGRNLRRAHPGPRAARMCR